jgi:hypothetical protein
MSATFAASVASITSATTTATTSLTLTTRVHTYAAAAPVSGAHIVGDIVYSTTPAATGYIGWVCTVAGTPGTWQLFGVVAT